MKVEIISIGDEILIGQIPNTNAQWIGELLTLNGFEVTRITTLSDKRNSILSGLKNAESNADIIISTGGLGPTKDDITKDALCDYFNTTLERHEPTLQNIDRLFGYRGFKMTPSNIRQADLPKVATPLLNGQGTAPGLWFEKGGKVFVFLPGVPFEMKSLMEHQVLQKLRSTFETIQTVYRVVMTHGKGESFVSETVEEWEDNLPDNVSLAYLPSPGVVKMRLMATGRNKETLLETINTEIVKLQQIIPELIYGFDGELMEEVIGKLLKQKKQTIATAESCTGGYIAHLITSVPGSSAYFKGSVIAYSNEIKERELGVKTQSLIDHGAVSEEVVKQMAENARKKINTDYALAISGIAGPDGGTKEKPVGTVWIAVASKDETITRKFIYTKSRERNIKLSAITALNMLRKVLLNA